ncbi:MAG: alpha/beta hydrolase [Woeseiaceae bacterium]
MRRSAENIFIQGPAGQLEGLLESQRDSAPVANAVIYHPHPMHGGTMHNKVVHTLARAFVGREFSAMRFNFRGAGQSDGEYDDGRGELLDALAAIQWMRARGPELPLWLAGFSFGAAIAVRASLETHPNGLISVAPAVSRLAVEPGSQPDCPWLIIQGDQDELVDIDDTVDWINRLEPGPELTVFPDTTHFFHGKLILLRQAVEDFVEANSYKTLA